MWQGRHGRGQCSRLWSRRQPAALSHKAFLPISVIVVNLVPVLSGHQTRPNPGGLFRWLKRSSLLAAGVLVVIAGILIAPLPGPGGVPVIALGLILILRSSYRAKRYFIRAQYARPRWVYPFRRLLRRNPEFGPVFWQQALRAEKMVLRRRRRPLIRLRKKMRRMWRRAFG